MYPRAKTLGLIIKDNYILLEEQEGKHSKGMGCYYRPIGGTIKHGEKSDETLIREFYEELGVEIDIIRYISCLENIFKIGDNMGHELIQLYIVEFKNQRLNKKEKFNVTEGLETTIAKWVSKEEIISEEKVLYPNGLKDWLKEII